ncbi:MAG: hypothetical protein WCA44_16615 [Acidobacteriaceae bacterium]
MRSRSVLAACGLAAWLCLGAIAQTTTPAPSTTQQNPQQNPQGGLAPGAPPLQLQNLPAEEHTLTPAEQAQIQRRQAYQAALRIANLTARWGPAMSTPGVALSLVEAGRTKTAAGATQVTYRISGSGFRAGERLNLVRWPLGESVKPVMSGLILNAQGIAVCGGPASPQAPPTSTAQPDTPGAGLHPAPSSQADSGPLPPGCADTMQANQPVEIQATAAPGEAIRVALIGEDHSNGAAAQAVPFPIVNTDKSCSLQVLLGMKDADMVVVEGAGLPPNSAIKLETTTGTQTRILNAKTDGTGKMALAVLPAVTGQTAGTTTVRYAGLVAPPAAPATSAAPTVTAPATPPASPSEGACAPAVSFPWGASSYKPQ